MVYNFQNLPFCRSTQDAILAKKRAVPIGPMNRKASAQLPIVRRGISRELMIVSTDAIMNTKNNSLWNIDGVRTLVVGSAFVVRLSSLSLSAQRVSYSDLLPPGAIGGIIHGGAAGQQAGYAFFPPGLRAGIWSGTSGSFIDLNPVGAAASTAFASSGNQQAGFASFGSDHAGIWSGTAGSFVDLNPSGASRSYAYATTGNQQAVTVTIGSVDRAAYGTALQLRLLTFIQLEPPLHLPEQQAAANKPVPPIILARSMP
jgi:hypothetical protein